MNALKEQRRLAFEAIFRNAEADDATGDAEKVIASLQPYVTNAELAEHELLNKAQIMLGESKGWFETLRYIP